MTSKILLCAAGLVATVGLSVLAIFARDAIILAVAGVLAFVTIGDAVRLRKLSRYLAKGPQKPGVVSTAAAFAVLGISLPLFASLAVHPDDSLVRAGGWICLAMLIACGATIVAALQGVDELKSSKNP